MKKLNEITKFNEKNWNIRIKNINYENNQKIIQESLKIMLTLKKSLKIKKVKICHHQNL